MDPMKFGNAMFGNWTWRSVWVDGKGLCLCEAVGPSVACLVGQATLGINEKKRKLLLFGDYNLYCRYIRSYFAASSLSTSSEI